MSQRCALTSQEAFVENVLGTNLVTKIETQHWLYCMLDPSIGVSHHVR